MRLEPGGLRRYCQICRTHVHDLSAMDERRARTFLAAVAELEPCVAYDLDEHGRIVFADRARGDGRDELVPVERLRRPSGGTRSGAGIGAWVQLAGAVSAVALLGACTPHGDETTVRIVDEPEAAEVAAPVLIPAAPPVSASHEPPAAEPCDPTPPAPSQNRPRRGRVKRMGVRVRLPDDDGPL